MRIVLACLAALLVGAGQKAAPGRRCLLEILHVDRDARRTDLFNNDANVNYDAAGHVKMRCQKQNVFLDTDSLSSISGDYVRLYGHAVYRDTGYVFTADTMIYLIRTEKLHAGGNVTVFDRLSGSTLKGPYVDYWREVKGVNDSARVEALLRPTVRYFGRGTIKDTLNQSPYIMTGDNLKGFGQSRLNGAGKVTIDRDSLHGDGDSIAVDRGTNSVAQLIGVPARLRRRGTDSFVVLGKEINVRSENDTIRDLRAFLTARVTRGAVDIAGDTVHMAFSGGKLDLMLAWRHPTGATLHSGGYDVSGDSVALDTPHEQLREIRVFRNGLMRNPLDTLVSVAPRHPGDSAVVDTIRNQLTGERIVARFGEVDSAGTLINRLLELQAFGKGTTQATSFFGRNDVDKNGKRSPSINYTRAESIFVVMKGGDSAGVSSVRAFGNVTGMQLETESTAKKADTTKKVVPGGRP